MTPEDYCEQKTRASGSSFYYAFIFLPPDQRRAMMALYAFCREVDDIADNIVDQHIAEQKIFFWKREIENVFRQKATHPVSRELCWSIQKFQFTQELLDEILDGMLMDIHAKPMVQESDLSLYCYRVAGVVGLLSIEVFGYRERQSRDFATSLGEAMQLTNILRDIPEDAKRGRIYLPQSVRAHFHVSDQDIKTGHFTASTQALLKHYRQKANALYQQALDSLPQQDRVSLRPSLIMASIYHHHLNRLEACDGNVWQQSVRLMPIHKLWIAWRCWRYEKRAERLARKGVILPIRLDF